MSRFERSRHLTIVNSWVKECRNKLTNHSALFIRGELVLLLFERSGFLLDLPSATYYRLGLSKEVTSLAKPLKEDKVAALQGLIEGIASNRYSVFSKNILKEAESILTKLENE